LQFLPLLLVLVQQFALLLLDGVTIRRAKQVSAGGGGE
jgi:hypothetical protein